MNLTTLFEKPLIIHLDQSLYCYVQHDNSAMRRHIRKTKHGYLFLEGFRAAAETLKGKQKEISEPILAIYSYTRIKSILFYAWQAKLTDEKTEQEAFAFASDIDVSKHIEACLRKGYINRYCQIHSFSNEVKDTIYGMLQACLDKTSLPDMREVFA